MRVPKNFFEYFQYRDKKTICIFYHRILKIRHRIPVLNPPGSRIYNDHMSFLTEQWFSTDGSRKL